MVRNIFVSVFIAIFAFIVVWEYPRKSEAVIPLAGVLAVEVLLSCAGSYAGNKISQRMVARDNSVPSDIKNWSGQLELVDDDYIQRHNLNNVYPSGTSKAVRISAGLLPTALSFAGSILGYFLCTSAWPYDEEPPAGFSMTQGGRRTGNVTSSGYRGLFRLSQLQNDVLYRYDVVLNNFLDTECLTILGYSSNIDSDGTVSGFGGGFVLPSLDTSTHTLYLKYNISSQRLYYSSTVTIDPNYYITAGPSLYLGLSTIYSGGTNYNFYYDQSIVLASDGTSIDNVYSGEVTNTATDNASMSNLSNQGKNSIIVIPNDMDDLITTPGVIVEDFSDNPGEVIPASPTGLNLVPGDGVISVGWNQVSGATSYNLYLNDVLYKSGITGTHYVITNLDNLSEYVVGVSAVNALGESVVTSLSQSPSATVPEGAVTLTGIERLKAIAATKAPFAWISAFSNASNQLYGNEDFAFSWNAGWDSSDEVGFVALGDVVNPVRSMSTVVILSVCIWAAYWEVRRFIG